MPGGCIRWLTVSFVLSSGLAIQGAKVDLNRDIRPVVSDTCFRCHGFDAKARKAQLRLDGGVAVFLALARFGVEGDDAASCADEQDVLAVEARRLHAAARAQRRRERDLSPGRSWFGLSGR